MIAGVAPYGVDGLDFMAGMGEGNVIEFGAAVQGEDALRADLDSTHTHLKDVTVDAMFDELMASYA